MNTSAQAHIRVELLNYGTLTQIPVIKSFCLFTSHHSTKPSKYLIKHYERNFCNLYIVYIILIKIEPDIQYNIQTGAIVCQFGPSMINSLMAAVQLWKNSSYLITTPYIICNDTNFEIM